MHIFTKERDSLCQVERDKKQWKVDKRWERFIDGETRELRLADKPEP